MRATAVVLSLLLGCSSGTKSPGDTSDTADAPDTAEPAVRTPILGLLQFRVEHNLENEDCIGRGDCFGHLEETDDIDGWLADIAADTTAPVLHWDRPIPWDVMATPAPADADAAAFHDARLDPSLVAWVDAFAVQFAAHPGGYLAVSVLDGDRASLAPLWRTNDQSEDVGAACADLGPGTLLDIDGTEVEVAAAYAEFVRYLHAKLNPARLAILVEANAYAHLCPAQWPDMVALYHDVYDRTRARVDPDLPVFATLTLVELLGFDAESCYGGLRWTTCDDPVAEPPEAVSAEACFPLHAEPLLDLAEGDRMDLLALSFYPHAMDLAPPGVDLDVAVWEGGDEPEGTCTAHARYPRQLDPLDQLDRLPWDGPVALAETSARGCDTWAALDDASTSTRWWVSHPGSQANQQWWTDRLVEASVEHELDMLVWAFRNDYAPIGPWVLRDGLADTVGWSLMNRWACSGIRDADGADKDSVTSVWLDSLPGR